MLSYAERLLKQGWSWEIWHSRSLEHDLRGKIAEVVNNFEHVTQFQIETPILEGGHLTQVQ